MMTGRPYDDGPSPKFHGIRDILKLRTCHGILPVEPRDHLGVIVNGPELPVTCATGRPDHPAFAFRIGLPRVRVRSGSAGVCGGQAAGWASAVQVWSPPIRSDTSGHPSRRSSAAATLER